MQSINQDQDISEDVSLWYVFDLAILFIAKKKNLCINWIKIPANNWRIAKIKPLSLRNTGRFDEILI